MNKNIISNNIKNEKFDWVSYQNFKNEISHNINPLLTGKIYGQLYGNMYGKIWCNMCRHITDELND